MIKFPIFWYAFLRYEKHGHFCECGCGQKLPFRIDGDYSAQFLFAHKPQYHPQPWSPRLCKCGCGEWITEIYRRPHMAPTDQLKFIPGHQSRKHWLTAFQGLIFQPRWCKKCGAVLADSLDNILRHCESCRKAERRAHNNRPGHAHGTRKRCKKFGVPFESFDELLILDRDDWTCQICGVPAPKEKRRTYDDDAPEVDHIWPLGATKNGQKGPGHIPSNCRCCCRKCNLARSNKFIDESVSAKGIISYPSDEDGPSIQELGKWKGLFWREFFGRLEYRLSRKDHQWLKLPVSIHSLFLKLSIEDFRGNHTSRNSDSSKPDSFH